MVVLRYIQPEKVGRIWPEVSPLLQRAAEHGIGEHTPATMFCMIEEGRAQLWVGQEYGEVVHAIVTHLVRYPTGLAVCEFMACGGERVDEWARIHAAAIEHWALKNGCDACEMIGRPGWQKYLPDYKLRHVRLVKDLRNESQKCA